MIENEKRHYTNLLNQQQKSSEKIQPVEPKVDAFAYASKLYSPFLKEKMRGVMDFHDYVIDIAKKKKSSKLNILSLGSGTGDWEVGLMTKEPSIKCELVDINEELLKGTQEFAKEHDLDLRVNICDINEINLNRSSYDIVVARSSLHHFIELEHIFSEVNKTLPEHGEFLVIGEVIGRNGLQLYPETKNIAQKIFDILPAQFRYNHYTKETDVVVPDINHSKGAFEAIRSQEIMPLLFKYFKPKEYVAYDAFLSLLLDFRYGPNYNLALALDKSLVKMITFLDLYYISNSILKPTCLFGIFSKKSERVWREDNEGEIIGLKRVSGYAKHEEIQTNEVFKESSVSIDTTQLTAVFKVVKQLENQNKQLDESINVKEAQLELVLAEIRILRSINTSREKDMNILQYMQEDIEKKQNEIKALNKSSKVMDLEIRNLHRELDMIKQSITWRLLRSCENIFK